MNQNYYRLYTFQTCVGLQLLNYSTFARPKMLCVENKYTNIMLNVFDIWLESLDK